MHQVDASASVSCSTTASFQGQQAETHRRNSSSVQGRRTSAGLLQPRPHRPLRQHPQSRPPGLPGADLHRRHPDLAAIMLGDAADRGRRRGLSQPQAAARGSRRSSLFNARDVFRTATSVQGGPLRQGHSPWTRASRRRFINAGHLLGSAMIHLRTPRRSRPAATSVLTGDLGRPGDADSYDPDAVPPARSAHLRIDLRRPHPRTGRRDRRAARGQVVRRVSSDGKVIIPAFDVGRTQTIVYFLHAQRREQ